MAMAGNRDENEENHVQFRKTSNRESDEESEDKMIDLQRKLAYGQRKTEEGRADAQRKLAGLQANMAEMRRRFAETQRKRAEDQSRFAARSRSLEDSVDNRQAQAEPEFDKDNYKSLIKQVSALSGVKEEYDRYSTKKMNPAEIPVLRQALVNSVNSFLPEQAQYNQDLIQKYARENKLDELMQTLGADLTDILYDPKLNIQKEYISKFPEYVSEEYKGFTKKMDKISGLGLYLYFYQPMSKALEKSSIQLKDENVPGTMKKCISADHNGTAKSKEDIKEIVDEVVDAELDKVYGKDTDKDAVELAKYFTKKSYQRRFKFQKEDILGEYMKLHSEDFKTYLKNGAEAMATIEGSDEIDSGKKRLGAIKNYMDIYGKYADKVGAYANAMDDIIDDEE